LQEAVDKIQNRYGVGKITRGLVLAAKKISNEEKKGLRLLPAGSTLYGY